MFHVYMHPNSRQTAPKLWAIARSSSGLKDKPDRVWFGACGKKLQSRDGRWDVIAKTRSQEREGYHNLHLDVTENRVQLLADALDKLIHLDAAWARSLDATERHALADFAVQNGFASLGFVSASSAKTPVVPVTPTPPLATPLPICHPTVITPWSGL